MPLTLGRPGWPKVGPRTQPREPLVERVETTQPRPAKAPPLVAEFCVAELAAALGVGTDSGRALMAHGLELKYRLPRLHANVRAGRVPVWRARRVAEQTLGLSPEAAAFVDAQVAAGRGFPGGRRVHRDARRTTGHGRPGDLARRQLTLDLSETDTATPPGPKSRQVVLHVHLSEAAIRGSGRLEVARVENHQRLVTAGQVRTWCANPDAQVVVKPVIDLNEHIHVEAYEVPDRLAAQTDLVDLTCAIPWCSRPARGCEKDHVIPHARGGPTATGNLASC